MQHEPSEEHHKMSKRSYQILYTVPEVCAMLRISRSKLYDLYSRGKIKAVKLDERRPRSGVRFRRQDLEAFADKNARFNNN